MKYVNSVEGNKSFKTYNTTLLSLVGTEELTEIKKADQRTDKFAIIIVLLTCCFLAYFYSMYNAP